MAAGAEFKVILTIDSQGNAKIEEVKRGLQDIGDTAAKSGQAGAASADEFAGALMRQLGVYALITAGLYKLEQTAVAAFKGAIQSVDDFKLTTIGVAATLTDLGKEGADSQKDYARNIAYSKDMYNELELAAARHFASGKDLVQGWNILAQKGVVLRKEEIDDLGTIVDKIKLATVGQVQAIQIAQELRAMLSGQARATDQLAMMVKDRYGAAWKDIIEQHREAGDLISWMANEFKGLKYAQEDIVTTMTAQKTTLDTLLSQVGRAGLAGAYSDIAGVLQQVNNYLRDHRAEIGGAIAQGWTEISRLIANSYQYVKMIHDIVSTPIVWLIKINFAGLQAFNDLMSRLPGPGSKSGIGGDAGSGAGGSGGGGGGGGWGGEGGPKVKVEPAPTRKLGGTAEKGGGKGRDTTDTIENLILQLRQEQAKLEEGLYSGNDAWYTKITEKIKKLAMDDKQLEDGMAAAAGLKTAKDQKVTDDFNKWYLGQMHQTTAAQIMEDEKKLKSVQGHTAEEGKVREVMRAHEQERSDKLALAENQQQKTYYDSLASSSLLIKDQVIWKEQSWQLEKKISQEQLEQWFKGKDITESGKDNYRSLLALTNAAKEYNLARQKAVDLGTLEGWAIERAGEALKREKTTIKDAMTGAEGFFTDALGQGIQGALSGQKKSFKEAGATIVQSMVLEMNKKSFTKVWDSIAKLLAPKPKSTTGGVTGGAENGLEVAAKDLQKGGLGLNSAGLQLGLSAGGLLLSGIGIATNSQALVYAGTILQVAGLAIQLYEALAATTTTATMTMAAGALTGSAIALTAAAEMMMIAAAVSSIPFFHGGGMVAHSGLLVAHGGLNLDERHVIAQVGEGIIQRDTMAEYARQGISFDMLNTGRLPVAALPVPSGSPGNGGNTVSISIGEIHVPVLQRMTDAEADAMVRRQIVPAINKELGRFGARLGRS